MTNTNPIDALLGDEGFVARYGGELQRDWYDVFLVSRVGRDTDIRITEGKNLLGVTYDIDETNVVTRIMPVGETAKGELLYLPELYIDSPYAEAYLCSGQIYTSQSGR